MDPIDIVKRIFIWPLLKEKPANTTDHEFLNAIFCVDTRHLCTYRALRDFEMPGLFMIHEIFPTQGITANRAVTRGSFVWVRKDDHDRFYHAEYAGQVFQLRPGEWRTVRKLLRKGRGQDGL